MMRPVEGGRMCGEEEEEEREEGEMGCGVDVMRPMGRTTG